MDSFISTFHIDWKIMIAQAINFIIVFIALYFLIIKPLKKVMSERTSTIERGIENAKENALLIKRSQEEYEKTILNAKKEATDLFQAGKKESEEKRVEMLAQAQADVEKMIEQGKVTLETEKNKMVEEAKNEVVSLVVKATEKILEDNQNKSIDKNTIERIRNI